ncbi:tetratricopeptide repeat protein [Kaistia dalseonensis]|uniref:Tetratricopeptide (TPR) repeat protein n=1 Tax=Kaistia dalseonensis TaxID=410840 RepID=A0ABU0HA78_9HYPH|nr:tetratricopeptide repeat protein [Kaistia dalseonensis]MCX5496597.1 tetratricopeptide repeat protein [Kaistia dalseonensis]MDQ0439220.1 tetratricopeptide (TPR) repeat protein [Kaistia dalseonensis]
MLMLSIAWASPSLSAPAGEGVPNLGAQTMDQLFTTLAKPGDETTGKAAEAEIQRRWRKSGSDTVDLLMGWATQSVATKDYDRALDFLDAVVTLKPDFAEGWNRRATIFYLQDEYGKALADLEKVLALQPRHFGALAGLGLILRDIDRKTDALAALQKAVDLDPYLDDSIRDAIKELKPSVDGQDI